MTDDETEDAELLRRDPKAFCAKHGHRWRRYQGGEPLAPRKVCGTCKQDVPDDRHRG